MSANKYYIGHTQDYIKRLEEHNFQDKFNTFTSKYRPWKLVCVFDVKGDRATAMKFEKYFKKQKSKVFIEKIVCSEVLLKGELAQLVRVPIA